MKIEEKLKKLKKVYLAATPNKEFKKAGFRLLKERIEEDRKKALMQKRTLMHYALTFACIILFIGISGLVLSFSQNKSSAISETIHLPQLIKDNLFKTPPTKVNKVNNLLEEIHKKTATQSSEESINTMKPVNNTVPTTNTNQKDQKEAKGSSIQVDTSNKTKQSKIDNNKSQGTDTINDTEKDAENIIPTSPTNDNAETTTELKNNL